MPFLDLHDDTTAGFVNQTFDYTIVGAGAAGILLSVKLSEAGYNVLLIESGNFYIDDHIQKLNQVIESGKKMGGVSWGRKRAIGGSTLAWGGQSLPFSPLDFEKRDWVSNSGWPISYAELMPFYKQANQFMKIEGMEYEGERLFHKIALSDRPLFDPSKLKYHVSKWARQPNFKTLYNSVLKKNVTVLFHAVLEHITINNNRAQNITVINHLKKKFTLNVRYLLLTPGGIETNRILLNNNHLIKNESARSILGTGFMEHPCIDIGKLSSKKSYRLQRFFNTHTDCHNKISIRLSLAESQQVRNQLLNGSAMAFFSLPENVENPYIAIKRFLNRYEIKYLKRLPIYSKDLIRSAYALIFHKFYYKAKAEANIKLMVEQEAIHTSFISLSEVKDYLGHPVPIVNWDISPRSWRTIVQMTSLIKTEFERLKLGQLQVRKEIDIDNKDWQNLVSDVNHHMGGTRMSDLPETGIVDPNLKLWGTDNLYICSCSVFPTSSHSNPTLTLLALAARLSHFLIHQN
ncbi:GMC family oxidoreductase (plasmid) [Pedobacter sp. BS3]|uniref:GMC oxidoreductase n=1 Tax=Pedobacter sp. BS3 TaxID=2567937 RepID=UPI0011EF2403|nr:GMC oxidoreductase [Pedobacter sp. BS3]TZF86212.1 GMC family oxidoreductase [Pedobacter sp. BS3]